MARFIGAILRTILAFVGAFMLPKDLKDLWQFGRENILPPVLPWVGGFVSGGWLSWASEPTRLQVALTVVGVVAGIYFVLLLFIMSRQRLAKESREVSKVRPQSPDAEFAARRKAVRQLLGDALEQGLNLQKGMYCQGERLRDANQEDVEKWVDRTRDLIQDAFGKLKAQHFLSREGYSDEDLLGRVVDKKYYKKFPPRFLNDKYFVKARLKRLHGLCQGDLPEINLDFNPDAYPSDWIRR